MLKIEEIEDIKEKIDGISILVGTAKCNANCPECAGRQHRKNAPLHDGEIQEARLREVLDYCYWKDCRYITLTGAAEPTLSPLSVTKTLRVLKEYEVRGQKFDPVNLYTNGIRIGFEPEFCQNFFPEWHSCGLTRIYISVYDTDALQNAKAFHVSKYPELKVIFNRVKEYGFHLRTSVILKKGYTDTKEKLQSLCDKFFSMGVDNVSAWPLKNEDDSISALAPDKSELERMRGLADGKNIRLLLGDSNAKEMLGKKIALFQDGSISDVWCARR